MAQTTENLGLLLPELVDNVLLDVINENMEIIDEAEGDMDANKMDKPRNAGTQGQLLQNDGNGGAVWADQGTPSDAQVATAVDAWLDAHPEATTTVQDGAISRAKLNADLQAKTDAVADLTAAIGDVNGALAAAGLVIYNGQFYINPDGNSLSA